MTKTDLQGTRLLVIGAGGFIGGFIAEEGLRRGMDVTVAVRKSTSRRYLTDPRLHFLVLDYDDPTSLTATFERSTPWDDPQALHDALEADGPWDYIIYNLGATKAVNYGDFKRVNFEYLRRICEVLKSTGRAPRRLLFMSSLSAIGPGDEKNYTPLDANTVPAPNTASRKSWPSSIWNTWPASHTSSSAPQASTALTNRTTS